MSSLILKGDTSGQVTIQAPAVAGTTTLALPATSSTLATQNALGVRNLIINGDMRIDQRNAGSAVTINSQLSYTVDRWFVYNSQAVNVTAQKVSGSNIGANSAIRLTGVSGTTNVNLGQRIENLMAQHLDNQQITVSCKLYSSTTLSNTKLTLFYCSGNNAGYGTTIESINLTINAGLNNIQETITLPSIASYGFECALQFTSGDLGNGVTVDIGQFQLEVGDTATPFEHRPYDMELLRCQRYYHKITGSGSGFTGPLVVVLNIANIYPSWIFPVTMRAGPTVTPLINNGSGANFEIGAGGMYQVVNNSQNSAFGYTASAEL